MTHENDRLIKLPRPPTPGRHMGTWKYIVAYLCIWFMVVAFILVYFTSTGSPQAGIIEVGIFTSIFVFLFHLVIRFFPFISKIFSSVVIIGLGIALIYINYYFLRTVKKDAPFEQLLIGDLLLKKIIKNTGEDQTPIAIKKNKEVHKYEKPLPVISLNQLEKSMEAPTMAGSLLSNVIVITPIHPVKESAISLMEKYSTESPKYEKTLPALPLDRLKKFITGPVAAKYELPHITTTASTMRVKPMSIGKKYKTETHISGGIGIKASHLEFTKKHEPLVQEYLDRSDFKFLPLLGSVKEIMNMIPEIPKIQPPLSETTSILMINHNEPLKENRIETD